MTDIIQDVDEEFDLHPEDFIDLKKLKKAKTKNFSVDF